jgi:FkbM family methyltransferase
MRGKRFFGQTGEDAIIQLLLTEKKGFYLDIGAGSPIKASNTFYFYRKGWSGLAIDPIEENRRLFRILRRRDQFLRRIVSEDKEDLLFWEFIPNECSTSNLKVAKEIIEKNSGILKRSYHVPTLQISELGLTSSPLDPTLLSIDVEGMDFEVLKSNNWREFLPRVIVIEEWGYSGGNETEIGNFLLTKGYKRFAWTSLSSIFVHEEYLKKKWRTDSFPD